MSFIYQVFRKELHKHFVSENSASSSFIGGRPSFVLYHTFEFASLMSQMKWPRETPVLLSCPTYSITATGSYQYWSSFPYKFDYFNYLTPNIVLPISKLPNIAQKTICTHNIPLDVTFILKYVTALYINCSRKNQAKTAQNPNVAFFLDTLYEMAEQTCLKCGSR